MNSFASTLLSLLLSWLRSLIGHFWRLLESDQGQALLPFLRDNWPHILLIICIGGFVIDRVVYFFRWRPDYVWATNLARWKRRLSGEEKSEKESEEKSEKENKKKDKSRKTRKARKSKKAPRRQPAPHQDSRPPMQAEPSVWPEPPQDEGYTIVHTPLVTGDRLNPAEPQATFRYAPIAGEAAAPAPMATDSTISWITPPLQPEPFSAPMAAGSILDISADVDDEAPALPAFSKDDPLHPGLDSETLQQSIGLAPTDSQNSSVPSAIGALEPAASFPNTSYVSYTQNDYAPPPPLPRGPLSQLAQKARSLMSMSDEEHPPSIRDFQSTVDMRDAFHAPVFPNTARAEDKEE